jgi:hypothetical protein
MAPTTEPDKVWENVTADADQGFEVQVCHATGEHRFRAIDAWGATGAWEPGVPPHRPPPKLKPRLRRRF